MAAERYGSLPFQEQIRFFRSKTAVPTERWADVWRAGHDKAFMVAGAQSAELLADLQTAVGQAIAEGRTLRDFQRDFDQIVQRHGWTYNGSRGWRTRLIYETNLRASYQAGRFAQLQRVARSRPYWLYRHSDAVATPRPLHLAWDGKILRHDDPWWQAHFPPNGWGCKCRVLSLSERDLARRGKAGPDSAPDDGTREWVDPVTGEVHEVPVGVDPGWDYTPGASVAEHARTTARRQSRRMPPEIGQQLRAAVENPPAPPEPPRGEPLEHRPATTLRQATAQANRIVQSRGVVDYQVGSDGLPLVRFRHNRRRGEQVRSLYGKASYAGVTVELANVVNEELVALAEKADSLGIPRLRGVNTGAHRQALASMGDGVLAINKLMARYTEPRDRVTELGKLRQRLEQLRARLASIPPGAAIGETWRTKAAQLEDQVRRLEAGDDVHDVLSPPSTWRPGQPATSRPFGAEDYISDPVARVRLVLWHEFGHHLHQQYKVTDAATYRLNPPLEQVLARLFRDRRVSPSRYADTNPKEWFAESYALYHIGRQDLIDPALNDLIRRVEAGEDLP